MIKPIPFGKYLLLDKIATGGMAEIFIAMTRGLGGFEKILVIKRILPHHTANKEFLSMFIDEARLTVQLNHSNIVQIYDFGEVQGHYYLAMEYVEGKNLREILARIEDLGEKMPLPHVLFLVSEIAKGLDYAHRKKDDKTHGTLRIVHRDISPQNILVSFEGEPKLIDFGIALADHKEEKRESGILKGKFGYMSPEQATNQKMDHLSDIFSCGIVLYELLTCQRLFSGENDLEILSKIKKCHIPSPSLFNPDVPEEVEKIIFQALKKDPKERFQKASDLQKELVNILYKTYPTYTSHELSFFLKRIFAHEVLEHKKKMKEIISMISEMVGNDHLRIQKPPHSIESFVEGRKESHIVESFERKMEHLDTYVGKKSLQEEIVPKEEVRGRKEAGLKGFFQNFLSIGSIVVLAFLFFLALKYLFQMSPERTIASPGVDFLEKK